MSVKTISKSNNTPNETAGKDQLFKIYDFSFYLAFEDYLSKQIREVDLENLIKDILFHTKDTYISMKFLKFVLERYFVKNEEGSDIKDYSKFYEIMKFLKLAFLTRGASKANRDEIKEAYKTYRRFNIKIFILESLNYFSFKNFDHISDETNINKDAVKFDSITIILIFLIFCKIENAKKSEILFNILNYDNKNYLVSNSNSLNVLLRKLLFIILYMGDSGINNFISSLSSEIKSKADYNGEKEVKDCGGDLSKLLSIDSYNKYISLFKKTLFFIKETRGLFKDFVIFISHNLIFSEAITNQKIDKVKFLQICKNKNYGLFSPIIIREYLIEFIQFNMNKFKLFCRELPKIIIQQSKKLINSAVKQELDFNSKKFNYVNRHIIDLNSEEDFDKYYKILLVPENYEFIFKRNEFLNEFILHPDIITKKSIVRLKTCKDGVKMNSKVNIKNEIDVMEILRSSEMDKEFQENIEKEKEEVTQEVKTHHTIKKVIKKSTTKRLESVLENFQEDIDLEEVNDFSSKFRGNVKERFGRMNNKIVDIQEKSIESSIRSEDKKIEEIDIVNQAAIDMKEENSCEYDNLKSRNTINSRFSKLSKNTNDLMNVQKAYQSKENIISNYKEVDNLKTQEFAKSQSINKRNISIHNNQQEIDNILILNKLSSSSAYTESVPVLESKDFIKEESKIRKRDEIKILEDGIQEISHHDFDDNDQENEDNKADRRLIVQLSKSNNLNLLTSKSNLSQNSFSKIIENPYNLDNYNYNDDINLDSVSDNVDIDFESSHINNKSNIVSKNNDSKIYGVIGSIEEADKKINKTGDHEVISNSNINTNFRYFDEKEIDQLSEIEKESKASISKKGRSKYNNVETEEKFDDIKRTSEPDDKVIGKLSKNEEEVILKTVNKLRVDKRDKHEDIKNKNYKLSNIEDKLYEMDKESTINISKRNKSNLNNNSNFETKQKIDNINIQRTFDEIKKDKRSEFDKQSVVNKGKINSNNSISIINKGIVKNDVEKIEKYNDNNSDCVNQSSQLDESLYSNISKREILKHNNSETSSKINRKENNILLEIENESNSNTSKISKVKNNYIETNEKIDNSIISNKIDYLIDNKNENLTSDKISKDIPLARKLLMENEPDKDDESLGYIQNVTRMEDSNEQLIVTDNKIGTPDYSLSNNYGVNTEKKLNPSIIKQEQIFNEDDFRKDIKTVKELKAIKNRKFSSPRREDNFLNIQPSDEQRKISNKKLNEKSESSEKLEQSNKNIKKYSFMKPIFKTNEEFSRIENNDYYTSEGEYSVLQSIDKQFKLESAVRKNKNINLENSNKDYITTEENLRPSINQDNLRFTLNPKILTQAYEKEVEDISPQGLRSKILNSGKKTTNKRQVNMNNLLLYFKNFEQMQNFNIEKSKSMLYKLDTKKFLINTQSINLKLCKKNEVYDLLENKVSLNIINFYLWILQNYNKFLVQNSLLKTEVRFVDGDFFRILQDNYMSDRDYTSILSLYDFIFFDDNNRFFINEKSNSNLLIVPIYFENPITGLKNLFIAKLDFKKKHIMMYDACDILFKDASISKFILLILLIIASNYKVILETFFAFLIENKVLNKSYSNWKIEVNLNCTCYMDEDYPIIVLLHLCETICKDEEYEFNEDAEYESWKENLFLQISQFYLKLHE